MQIVMPRVRHLLSLFTIRHLLSPQLARPLPPKVPDTLLFLLSSHGSVSLLPYLQILATGPRVPAPRSALFIIWLYLIVTLLLTTYHHSLFALACVLFSCPLLLPHRRHGLSSTVPSPVYN